MSNVIHLLPKKEENDPMSLEAAFDDLSVFLDAVHEGLNPDLDVLYDVHAVLANHILSKRGE